MKTLIASRLTTWWFDQRIIRPRDIWPRTFDHSKVLWHLTSVTLDCGHLNAIDIWPKDFWPPCKIWQRKKEMQKICPLIWPNFSRTLWVSLSYLLIPTALFDSSAFPFSIDSGTLSSVVAVGSAVSYFIWRKF